LIIESSDAFSFVVFADYILDAETVIKRKILKGSLVSVRGKLRTFGALAVNQSDYRLQQLATKKRKKENLRILTRELEELELLKSVEDSFRERTLS